MTNPKAVVACAQQNIKVGEYNSSFEDRKQHLQVYVDNSTQLQYGSCFKINGIQPIVNKYNNRSSFNYRRYMKSKQILYSAKATTEVSNSNNRLAIIKQIRESLITRNCQNFNQICPYVNSLVFGTKDIDKQIKDRYGQIGITALFVISGMHIRIIYELLMYLLTRMRIIQPTAIKCSLLIIVIYSILAGNSVAVNRAVLMLLFKHLLGLKPKQCIFITFLVTLCSNPFNILNIGYVISYWITMVIIFLPTELYANSSWSLLRFSILCYLFIFPLSFSFNYTVNLLTPLAMIVFVPLVMGGLLIGSIIITIIPFKLGIIIVNVLVMIINFLTSLFDKFTFVAGHVSFFMWIIYWMLLSNLLKITSLKSVIYIVLWFSIILLNITVIPSITFIDVGQGDSALIKTFRKNYLVDVGNTPSQVISQLRFEGVSQLSGVFISHAHLDHYGALSEVSESIQIDNVYELAGNQIIDGSAGIEKPYTTKLIDVIPYYGSNDNDRELIVKFKLKRFSVLFPGDVELESEQYLVDNYCSELKSDIIKVPHHGSKTSSSQQFLDCVDPSIAVISSGKNNRYGHPDQEVVTRYRQRSFWYNTQNLGEIKFKFTKDIKKVPI